MKQILKHTWSILDSRERTRFSWLILADLLISVLDIVSLAWLLWIIRFYMEPGNARMPSWLPTAMSNRDSVTMIAVFFILYGLKNIAAFLIARQHYKLADKVAIRLSANKLSAFQHSDYNEFVNIDSSEYIRRIGFQPFEFSQHLLSGVQQIITQAGLITLAIIAILLFDARLFLLLLAILLPPVIIVFYWIKKKQALIKKNIQSANELSYRFLLDSLKGYIDSNINQRNDFFRERFIRARKLFSHSLFSSLALQTIPGRVIEIFAILGLFLLIAIAKWTGINDTGSLLSIGAFVAAAYKIIPGVVKIINTSGQMKAYEFSAKDLPLNPPQQAVAQQSPLPLTNIELHNVCFNYPGLPVLQDFNLVIKKGDLLGISGVSGRGKTTVLHILLGFLEPAAGEVRVNEKATNQQQLKELWPLISYVRQQNFFIHDTILRNITLMEGAHDPGRLRYAIEVSGLDSVLSLFPEGLEKMITENGKNISGGQQQRISIARAVYKKSDLILLDEPFNELDEASELKILSHFKKMAREGKMIVLVTHNSKTLSECSNIISLDGKG